MIPQAPFLFSMAGLSASLAGLAGLVAGLRRGQGIGPADMFRLRQIVEFSFANVLIGTSAIPLAQLVGDESTVVRVLAAVTLIYLAFNVALLLRRSRRLGVSLERRQQPIVGGIFLAAAGLAVVALATGEIAVLELLLLALLARPMIVFLFVLGAFQPEPSEPS